MPRKNVKKTNGATVDPMKVQSSRPRAAKSAYRRYRWPLDVKKLDSMAEDLRLASMDKGVMSVASRMVSVRAHVNGLSVEPTAETPASDAAGVEETEEMDHAEFQRRIGPLLDEYRAITGEDLFPFRKTGGEGPDDEEPVL